MTSFVYLIGPEQMYPGALVKIGTSSDVILRLRQFQSGSPIPLSLLWAAPGDVSVEAWLHAAFDKERKHGEWFDLGLSPVEVVESQLGSFMVNMMSSLVGDFPVTVDVGPGPEGDVDSAFVDPEIIHTSLFRRKVADTIDGLEAEGTTILNASDLAHIYTECGRSRVTMYDELNRLCTTGRLKKINGKPPYVIQSQSVG